MSKDVVLILSGGLDSSTLLYKLLNEGNSVTALSFNYGQKAAIEIERAAEICKMNDVPPCAIYAGQQERFRCIFNNYHT